MVLADLLKAAGEPTRLRLLNLLRFGNICVCDLETVLELPQPSISRHLATLRSAGLVTASRAGTRVVYALATARTVEAAGLLRLLDACCPTDELMKRDFERLKAAVSEGSCRLEIRPAEPIKTEPSAVQS